MVVEPKPYGWATDAPAVCGAYIFPLVSRLVAEAASPPARVLDAGSGNGALAGILAEAGFDVTGVDLSEGGVAKARERVPAGRFELDTVDVGLLGRLGVDPFDVAVCTEVLEHLYDPLTFLAGIHHALRPGGTVIVSTPYHGWLKNVLIAASGKFDRHVESHNVGGHVKFYSRDSLTRLLEQQGFGDVRFYGAGRLPKLWKSMVLTAVRT